MKYNFSDSSILDKGAKLFATAMIRHEDDFYRGFITSKELAERAESEKRFAESNAEAALRDEAHDNRDEMEAEMHSEEVAS